MDEYPFIALEIGKIDGSQVQLVRVVLWGPYFCNKNSPRLDGEVQRIVLEACFIDFASRWRKPPSQGPFREESVDAYHFATSRWSKHF